MTIKTIIRMGNPLLYQKAQPVANFNTPELNELIVDMWETMEAFGGVGIAAPQVGESLQLTVFGFEKSPRYGHANAVPKTVLTPFSTFHGFTNNSN